MRNTLFSERQRGAGFILIGLAACLGLAGCAVKEFPRAVSLWEKGAVNYAYVVDTAGAKLAARGYAGPGYDRERQKVQIDYGYYLQPEFRENPRLFYPSPSAAAVERVELLARTPRAEVWFIRWPSEYQPRNPAFASFYEQYTETHTAYGVLVENKERRQAALVISHGWTGGDVRKLWRMEPLLELADLGYDSVLVQQPYHGLRAPADSEFSGEYFFSGEVARINEAFCQAVTDVRSMVLWLRERYEVVGVRGGSLGGITTLLTAAVEERIDFAIAWVPPSSLGDMPEDSPLVPFVIEGLRASGLDQASVAQILYVSSPVNFSPSLPKEKILIFAGMGDNFVPPDQPQQIWTAWEEPPFYWFAGGHVLNFEKRRCQEMERAFLRAHLP